MKIRSKGGVDKVEQQMTPMIDIVFQLLTFFIMSFKLGTSEGDFSVKMPLGAKSAAAPQDIDTLPLKLRLKSDANGNLVGRSLNEKNFSDWTSMNEYVISIVGGDRGPGSARSDHEVEIDCDYNLHYEHVIGAIGAVSGFVDPAGNVVKLVEKIKFSPPRPAS